MEEVKFSDLLNKNRCSYFLLRKRRRCKMLTPEGFKFCAGHRNLIGDGTTSEGPHRPRVPCPLDTKHTCYADQLEKHLSKCNARPPLFSPPYYSKNINAKEPGEDNSSRVPLASLSLSALSDSELMDLIHRVNRVYSQNLKKFMLSEGESPPSVTSAMEKILANDEGTNKRENSSLRHLKQTAALMQMVEDMCCLSDASSPEDTRRVFLEMGAGRGGLTFWFQRCLKNELKMNASFILVDRASHRHKQENRLKDSPGIRLQRVRIDISDLVLSQLLPKEEKSFQLLVTSKHLCGAATDLALRCVVNSLVSQKERIERIQSCVLIATCCHHQCDWESYCGKEFFLSSGFKEQEFSLVSRLTSWLTCGLQKNKDKQNARALEDRYTRLNLPITDREEVGRRAKRILDFGRCHFLQKHSFRPPAPKVPGEELPFLCEYVTKEVTVENIVLRAVI